MDSKLLITLENGKVTVEIFQSDAASNMIEKIPVRYGEKASDCVEEKASSDVVEQIIANGLPMCRCSMPEMIEEVDTEKQMEKAEPIVLDNKVRKVSDVISLVNRKALTTRLLELSRKLKMKQSQLAREIGLPATTIYTWTHKDGIIGEKSYDKVLAFIEKYERTPTKIDTSNAEKCLEKLDNFEVNKVEIPIVESKKDIVTSPIGKVYDTKGNLGDELLRKKLCTMDGGSYD